MTAHASAASLEAASVHHPRRWLAAVVMMVAALMDIGQTPGALPHDHER